MQQVVSQGPGIAPAVKQPVSVGARRRSRTALELVALRGRDVVGVKHLLDGAVAYVGIVADSIARVPMAEFGGHPALLAECGRRSVVHVPPRARARIHPVCGLPRLTCGPCDVELHAGDRIVVVLGQVQVRAQMVTIDTFGRGPFVSTASTWIALLGGVYLAALALCAAFSPSKSATQLGHGVVQHAATHLAANVTLR